MFQSERKITVFYGLKTLSYRSPQLWSLVLEEIKQRNTIIFLKNDVNNAYGVHITLGKNDIFWVIFRAANPYSLTKKLNKLLVLNILATEHCQEKKDVSFVKQELFCSNVNNINK